MSNRRTNLITNPAFGRNMSGWVNTNPAWGTSGVQVPVPAQHSNFFVSSTGMEISWDTGGINGIYASHNFAEAMQADTPFHAEIKAAALTGETRIRLGIEMSSKGVRTNNILGDTTILTPGMEHRFVLDAVLPAGVDRIVFIFYRDGKFPATSPAKIVASDALFEAGTSGDYFDGSRGTGGAYSYGWNGTPHASTSYRMETIDLVHPWTRSWWESLPHAYKEADQHQNPELGGYPLLRWMNGIGQIAGEMRELSDSLWAGTFADPTKAPDSALRWLAMMLGLSEQHRQQPLPVLRERLVALTSVGRSASGTRAMIAESAKAYMLPGAQIRVEPSSQRPHYLIMYVRAYEVPNDDIEELARRVQAAGFVPAGHIIEAQRVITTWDDWEATAGKTWTDKEKNIRTWNESDSAGVILE